MVWRLCETLLYLSVPLFYRFILLILSILSSVFHSFIRVNHKDPRHLRSILYLSFSFSLF